MTTAIADAQASAQQTVDDARRHFEMVEVELHRQLAAAVDDLERQRDDVRALKNQLVIERAARARADASLAAAQATHHQVTVGYAERIHAVELELEAARGEAARFATDVEAESAERARLASILDSIRSAVSAGAPVPPAGPSESVHTETPEAPSTVAVVEASEEVEEQSAPPDPVLSDSGRNLKFVARGPAEHDVVLSECAMQLLDQVEASYQTDVRSLESPFDVVDRLVTQLRTSRELFLMRCGNDEALASEEFDRRSQSCSTPQRCHRFRPPPGHRVARDKPGNGARCDQRCRIGNRIDHRARAGGSGRPTRRRRSARRRSPRRPPLVKSQQIDDVVYSSVRGSETCQALESDRLTGRRAVADRGRFAEAPVGNPQKRAGVFRNPFHRPNRPPIEHKPSFIVDSPCLLQAARSETSACRAVRAQRHNALENPPDSGSIHDGERTTENQDAPKCLHDHPQPFLGLATVKN